MRPIEEMADEPSEIEQEIETQRRQLAQHLDQLQGKVEHAEDWRTYVQPRTAVIAAIALGACVALVIWMRRK